MLNFEMYGTHRSLNVQLQGARAQGEGGGKRVHPGGFDMFALFCYQLSCSELVFPSLFYVFCVMALIGKKMFVNPSLCKIQWDLMAPKNDSTTIEWKQIPDLYCNEICWGLSHTIFVKHSHPYKCLLS